MALAEFGVSLWKPFVNLWYGVVNAVPGIVAGIVILIFGYLVASLLSWIVQGVLDRIKFDRWVLEKTNMTKVVGAFRLSHFLSTITKWYVFILFLPPAAGMIYLVPLSNFLLEVARWIPHVIIAVVLGLIGLMAADYVSARITETKAKFAGTVAWVASIVIYIFTALIVLAQIGVRVEVATSSFLIILAGVMLAIGLAFGIGFGLAMQDDAKKIVTDIRKRL